MSGASIGEIIDNYWNVALNHVRGSCVFIDEETAKVLQWNGGLSRVIKNGATKVKEFSIFETGSSSDSKAVFLISEPLNRDSTLSSLSTILRASCFDHCTVISSLPLQPTLDKTPSQFVHWLQRDIRECMGSLDDTISKVLHVPLCGIHILEDVLILPQFHTLFPPLPTDEETPQSLDPEAKSSIRDLVAILSQLLDDLGVREDLFSMGRLAYTLADELEQTQSTANRRRSVAQDAPKASVLFIDRTLDLVSPLSFQKDSMIDIMSCILTPATESNSTDSFIDMSVLSASKSKFIGRHPVVAAASLSCLCKDRIKDIHEMKWKQSPMILKKRFEELVQSLGCGDSMIHDQHNSPIPFVNQNIALLKNTSLWIEDRTEEVVETLALHETVSGDQYIHLLEKQAVEKIFIQNATENILSGALDAGGALAQLLQGRNKSKLELEDLLCYTFLLFSLCGDDIYIDSQSQDQIRMELVSALTDHTLLPFENWSSLVKDLLPSANPTEAQLQSCIARILHTAKRISRSRSGLKHYKNILRKGDINRPAAYKPLFKEIFEDFKVNIESPDIDEHTAALTDMLKSGLGFLMNVKTKKNPFDTDLMVLVVLGGITMTEVKTINEVTRDCGKKIIILTTALLKPKDTLRYLLFPTI